MLETNKLNGPYQMTLALITQIISNPCQMKGAPNVIRKIFKRGHTYAGVICHLASAAQRHSGFFVL